MAVNKVIYGGNTIIDLTNDTVTPETLAEGATAHDASGKEIRGTMPTTTVLYTEQNLTEEQKTQARENIDIDGVCVAKNQGAANVGKILVVGSDGNLTLADMPEGGASGDVTGILDENKNILLSGDIAVGTYTLMFENTDGTYTGSGTLEVSEIVTTYTITQNLTNATSNNSITSIRKGESFTATITANSGYELSSVVVTMGGSNVSVSNGIINIPSVTGDIVITAVAVEVVAEITNWIEEVGYTANTRLSLSSGNTTSATDYECTGFIPAKINDVIRVKNIDLTSENSTNIVFYDSSKNPIKCNGTYHGTSLATFFALEGNAVYKGTIAGTKYDWTAPTNTAYIRIGSKSITANSILTVNQEIV